MKILGLIPVRGGSKGIPNKNRKLLNGKPLMQYTIEKALDSKLLSRVIVSSEDDVLTELGKSFGADVPFKRPANLSLDTTPTIEVVEHALEFLAKNGEHYDAVCLLQVTTPFRTLNEIDTAINVFKSQNSDSLISVREVPHQFNPHWVFKANEDSNLSIATGDEKLITRRQDLPKSYFRDGSIYITKSQVILNEASLYGKNIAYAESTSSNFVNIDTLEDWEQAELIAKKINNNRI